MHRYGPFNKELLNTREKFHEELLKLFTEVKEFSLKESFQKYRRKF